MLVHRYFVGGVRMYLTCYKFNVSSMPVVLRESYNINSYLRLMFELGNKTIMTEN